MKWDMEQAEKKQHGGYRCGAARTWPRGRTLRRQGCRRI